MREREREGRQPSGCGMDVGGEAEGRRQRRLRGAIAIRVTVRRLPPPHHRRQQEREDERQRHESKSRGSKTKNDIRLLGSKGRMRDPRLSLCLLLMLRLSNSIFPSCHTHTSLPLILSPFLSFSPHHQGHPDRIPYSCRCASARVCLRAKERASEADRERDPRQQHQSER